MKTSENIQSQQKEMNDSKAESLKYQLDILKEEIQIINQTIARIDEITQTTKNWAIVTWAGSIAIALSEPSLRKYLILTAILPFLFWYIDAYWRRLQNRSIFRSRKISEFLNDERLIKTFEQKQLLDFVVFDPTGQQYRDTDEYKKRVSIWRTLKFPEIRVFYLTLASISLVLWIVFLLIP